MGLAARRSDACTNEEWARRVFSTDGLLARLERAEDRLHSGGTHRVMVQSHGGQRRIQRLRDRWHVIEADGHDVKALLDAFEEAESVKGHPSVILARTVKGKCISFAENNAAFHNGLLTAEQCKTAMCDLDAIRKGRE